MQSRVLFFIIFISFQYFSFSTHTALLRSENRQKAIEFVLIQDQSLIVNGSLTIVLNWIKVIPTVANMPIKLCIGSVSSYPCKVDTNTARTVNGSCFSNFSEKWTLGEEFLKKAQEASTLQDSTQFSEFPLINSARFALEMVKGTFWEKRTKKDFTRRIVIFSILSPPPKILNPEKTYREELEILTEYENLDADLILLIPDLLKKEYQQWMFNSLMGSHVSFYSIINQLVHT